MKETDMAAVPTLHILNKRPGHDRFRACLDAVGPDDTLLLIENAVVALADSTVSLPEGTCLLWADCEARGLSAALMDGMNQVDYTGMVRLTDRFVRVTSW